MRVRAAFLGFVAVGVLSALPGVGAAGTEVTTQTTTEKIEEADLSIEYPAEWNVVTSEIAKERDSKRATTHFAAVADDGTMVTVQSVTRNDNDKASFSAKAFKKFDRQMRARHITGDEYLGGARVKLGDTYGWRTEFAESRGTPNEFRQSQLVFVLQGADARRTVAVTVVATLDEEGKSITDRILRSVKRL